MTTNSRDLPKELQGRPANEGPLVDPYMNVLSDDTCTRLLSIDDIGITLIYLVLAGVLRQRWE
eukprot:12911896-Prorocentrum_lima.AAC.1